MGDRLGRYRALVGLAGRRVLARLRATERGQTRLAVAGVAVAIALMLLVTSVGLALVSGGAVGSGDVDYWVTPEGEASSAVASVEGARLGQVHPASERMASIDGVTHATPVLAELVRVNATGAEASYALAIGVIPRADGGSLVGLSTAALEPGDPHYANRSYDGPWTDEAVLSTGGADVVNASAGDRVTVSAGGTGHEFSVAAVESPSGGGIGQLPVVVVHLSELQSLTGAARGDTANQILVDAEPGADIESRLERIYPRSTVLTRGELLSERTAASQLPLAMGLAALVVAVVVGTLLVVTTMGFEVAAGSRERAVLSAVGLSRGSRLVLSAAETLALVLAGGVAGVAIWLVVGLAGNAVARAMARAAVFRLHPALVVYGLAVALGVGLLAAPYLLYVGRKTTSVEELTV